MMEKKHRNRLQASFNQLLTYKTIHVLDIPDDYQYMDPELMEILEEKITVLLEEHK